MTDWQRLRDLLIDQVAKDLGLKIVRDKAFCFSGHDSEPSLHLDKRRNLWRCYGCGQFGDVINLVKAVKGFGSKGDAARWLENWCGLQHRDLDPQRAETVPWYAAFLHGRDATSGLPCSDGSIIIGHSKRDRDSEMTGRYGDIPEGTLNMRRAAIEAVKFAGFKLKKIFVTK